jgi:CSLREA domain-containing protein
MSPQAASRVGVFVLAAVAAVPPVQAQNVTFTVDTTGDTFDVAPGDGVCADAAAHCSLRAAVMEANAGDPFAFDRVNLPAGLYRIDQGPLHVTGSLHLVGAGSALSVVESGGPYGVFELGNLTYARKLFQGTDTVTGLTLPRAAQTTVASFTNCLAAEGCLGKPGVVDTGGSNPLHPIAFDFPVTAAERAALAGISGFGVLTVEASRDIGHKVSNAVPDVVTASLDGTTLDDLFRDTIDTCPDGENDPINLECGPNFHTDVLGSSSLVVPQADFAAAAADGTIHVVLSPVSGAGNAGVGRLKIFSVQLLYLKRPGMILTGVTLQGASNSTILNNGANVDGFDLVIRSGSAVLGAGIWNTFGFMFLQDCTIAGNTAFGAGGVFNSVLSALTLDRCTVSGNTASAGSGGGVWNRGALILTNSTISGNLASLGGGGIRNDNFMMSAFNTITDNNANLDLSKNFDPDAVGGGIANFLGGRVMMSDTILAGNRDGRDSGLPAPPDLVSPDCFGRASPVIRKFVSQRDNVVGVLNGNCAIKDQDPTVTGLPFDQVGSVATPLDPGLAPLADNGGHTRTHALQPGSPAIDADHTPGVFDCPATDQRGFRRPGDNPGDVRCDAGAYEAGGMTAVPYDPETGQSPVRVTFSNITQPGITRVSVLPSGPTPPSGFMLGNPPVYVELSTTTGFTGSVTVCMDYSGITFPDPTMIKLLHYEDTNNDGVADTWVDRTTSVDTANKIVCATVTSFSLFAPFQAVERPPVADAGPDRYTECMSPSGAQVTLDGTASSDPDGDALQYKWTTATDGVVGITATVTLDAPFGASTFTLTVDDGRGLKATDDVVVTVGDTTGPLIGGLTASPAVLWPPDGRMVPVEVSRSAVDVCDPNPTCRIVLVTNDETGLGPDAEITGALTLSLRAERSGHGPGRIYRATVECRDAFGNTSLGTVAVTVPHDQR